MRWPSGSSTSHITGRAPRSRRTARPDDVPAPDRAAGRGEGSTVRAMDYVAIRERSVRRLERWKLPDPGVLPLHSDEDFAWVRDAHSVAARCHAIAAALALQH